MHHRACYALGALTMTNDARAKDLDQRIRGEFVDSFDEELEMEIDERQAAGDVHRTHRDRTPAARRTQMRTDPDSPRALPGDPSRSAPPHAQLRSCREAAHLCNAHGVVWPGARQPGRPRARTRRQRTGVDISEPLIATAAARAAEEHANTGTFIKVARTAVPS